MPQNGPSTGKTDVRNQYELYFCICSYWFENCGRLNVSIFSCFPVDVYLKCSVFWDHEINKELGGCKESKSVYSDKDDALIVAWQRQRQNEDEEKQLETACHGGLRDDSAATQLRPRIVFTCFRPVKCVFLCVCVCVSACVRLLVCAYDCCGMQAQPVNIIQRRQVISQIQAVSKLR